MANNLGVLSQNAGKTGSTIGLDQHLSRPFPCSGATSCMDYLVRHTCTFFDSLHCHGSEATPEYEKHWGQHVPNVRTADGQKE